MTTPSKHNTVQEFSNMRLERFHHLSFEHPVEFRKTMKKTKTNFWLRLTVTVLTFLHKIWAWLTALSLSDDWHQYQDFLWLLGDSTECSSHLWLKFSAAILILWNCFFMAPLHWFGYWIAQNAFAKFLSHNPIIHFKALSISFLCQFAFALRS
jgi:hypothetical protein